MSWFSRMYRAYLALLPAFLVALFASDVCGGQRLLIRAQKLYPGTGEALEPAAILIENGAITRIAQAISVEEGTEVEDFADGVLVPGFVDAYSHLGISGGDAEVTSEVTPSFRVEAAIDWQSREFRQALHSGTTTALIAPGTENVFSGIAVAVKTGGSIDHRLVMPDAGLFVTMASDPRSRNRSRVRPDSIYVRQPTNRMGVVWMIRSTLDQALRQAAGDHAVLRDALQDQTRMFFVSRTHFDIESALRLSDEFQFAPIIVSGRDAYRVAEELARRKIPVVLDPLLTTTSSGREGTRPAWNRAGLLHAAGVEFALSGRQLLDQARFAVRFGLPREVALQSITVTPARILGIDDKVGRIEVGRAADLVALDGEPLEFTTAIKAVFVNGQRAK